VGRRRRVPPGRTDGKAGNRGSVGPVVTAGRDRITGWTIAGGGKREVYPGPMTSSSWATWVSKTLATLIDTRWPGGTRGEVDKTIVLQVDPAAPADLFIRLCAAVRSDGTRELFPNIFLAGG